MKIGLVCPYNLFKGGGVQECVKALYNELLKRGHTVRIITPQPRGHDGVADDHVILLGGSTDVRSPFATTAQVSASVDLDALETMLAREQFDVLHFHEPWVPLLSRQILTRTNTVTIATFHAKLPETVMAKTIEKVITPYTRSILKYLDALTAVSPAAAEYVQELLPDAKINIVPNGIDLAKYKPGAAKQTTETKTILYIGRLEKRKGLKYLLQAYGQLAANQNVTLLIAGDGPDRAKLETYAKNHKLSNVRFLGFISEDEKIRLLKQADLFCSLALYGESFGIVLLEAMACGAVIVAGDNPGYNAVLKERGQLSLVDPKDTTELARRMNLLLYDDDLRALWREWALDYVKQFDYQKIAGSYETLYEATHKKQT